MDIKQLEYFLELARTHSLAKAADTQYISRQGLSKSVSMLEKELGVSLLTRTSSGTFLSPAGQALQPFAVRILADYYAAIHSIGPYADNQSPAIRFAVPYGFFENVSIDLFLQFFEKHPALKYDFQYFSDKSLLEQFLKGKFDFAITTSQNQLPQLDYYPLFRNYACLSVNQEHPLAKLNTIRVIDLKDIPIVTLGEGSFDYPFLIEVCRDAGFEPNLIVVQDVITVFQHLSNGKIATMRVGNISKNEKPDGCRNIFFAPEDLEKTAFDVFAVTVKGKKLSLQMCSLIQHLQDYCKDQIAQKNEYPYCLETL